MKIETKIPLVGLKKFKIRKLCNSFYHMEGTNTAIMKLR